MTNKSCGLCNKLYVPRSCYPCSQCMILIDEKLADEYGEDFLPYFENPYAETK